MCRVLTSSLGFMFLAKDWLDICVDSMVVVCLEYCSSDVADELLIVERFVQK